MLKLMSRKILKKEEEETQKNSKEDRKMYKKDRKIAKHRSKVKNTERYNGAICDNKYLT